MSLQEQWWKRRLSPALFILAPLAALFAAISGFRRQLYRWRLLKVEHLPVPVVVVGNITVGGAGKTPLTLAVAKALAAGGRRPGIVSRGYGGSAAFPTPVTADSPPSLVGDEPLLLARRSRLPVWVGRDRAAAARALLAAHPEVDLILCDDGLQHYRLGRDAEIAVFDSRGAGNGWPLPAGPLREPLSRLSDVDAVVWNGSPAPGLPAGFSMNIEPGPFYRLGDPASSCAAADLAGRPLHAVAGIGDPTRFFRTLSGLGLEFVPHPFPDHHAYTAADLDFGTGAVVLMTEKDGVKCGQLAAGEAWVLPVEAELPPALIDTIVEKIRGRPAP